MTPPTLAGIQYVREDSHGGNRDTCRVGKSGAELNKISVSVEHADRSTRDSLDVLISPTLTLEFTGSPLGFTKLR